MKRATSKSARQTVLVEVRHSYNVEISLQDLREELGHKPTTNDILVEAENLLISEQLSAYDRAAKVIDRY